MIQRTALNATAATSRAAKISDPSSQPWSWPQCITYQTPIAPIAATGQYPSE